MLLKMMEEYDHLQGAMLTFYGISLELPADGVDSVEYILYR